MKCLSLNIIFTHEFHNLFLGFTTVSVCAMKTRKWLKFSKKWGKIQKQLTERSCHVTRHVLFVGASIVRLYIERNHDSLHIFSKSFYIHFVCRRKIPPCLYNSPKMEQMEILKSRKCCRESDWYCNNATYIAFGM